MDEADLAQESIDFHLAHILAGVRGQGSGIGPDNEACENCGEEIPEARRRAVPGCTRCVKCQNKAEGGNG